MCSNWNLNTSSSFWELYKFALIANVSPPLQGRGDFAHCIIRNTIPLIIGTNGT